MLNIISNMKTYYLVQIRNMKKFAKIYENNQIKL